jgi:hypothetical protein
MPDSRTFLYVSFRFLNGASMERDARLQNLPLHILQVPQRGLYGEIPVSGTFLQISFRFPSKGALQVSLTERP